MPHAAAVPTAWKQLAATFVLGMDRAGAQALKVDGAVAELIAALPPNDSVARQLDAAACLSVFMRAGASFEAPRAGSAPCTDGGLRQPSLAASQLLASVLELGLPELLAEWCRLAGAARIRIADELLPQVLNRMADSPDALYTTAVIQTLGSRGRWLVEQNSTWKAALVVLEDPESAMESGSTIERVRALRLIRLKDAARARELLQSRLDGDAEERARLIAVLEHALSAAVG